MFLITDQYSFNHLHYHRDEFSQLEKKVYKTHTIETDALPTCTGQPYANSYHNEFLFNHSKLDNHEHVLNILC